MRSPEGEPLLAAQGLRRSYGPARVLHGVDVTAEPGETLVVIGPNGAGKSTLLRILAGLMRPSAGEVRVLGRRVQPGDPASRRPIGLLSHQSMLYDDLTLLENLAFTARLYGMPDPAGAARAALAQVDLDDRRDDVPRRLSRGMLQRAAIARALIHDPQLLLLDEPFTGLDVPAAERLRTLLAERMGTGRAMVLVTHQLEEAWDLADRVAVLVAGRWALQAPRAGAPAELLARYREALHA
ncbi:MAG: heme ABC exporter ATP-binding protein CcmA [Gemmatimonadota bacterium]|nr:heme ABC exporter ATP-binding protein CcmA [Gemmatimonadota bacterium]